MTDNRRIGIFFSGGLDSTLFAIMSLAGGERVTLLEIDIENNRSMEHHAIQRITIRNMMKVLKVYHWNINAELRTYNFTIPGNDWFLPQAAAFAYIASCLANPCEFKELQIGTLVGDDCSMFSGKIADVIFPGLSQINARNSIEHPRTVLSYPFLFKTPQTKRNIIESFVYPNDYLFPNEKKEHGFHLKKELARHCWWCEFPKKTRQQKSKKKGKIIKYSAIYERCGKCNSCVDFEAALMSLSKETLALVSNTFAEGFVVERHYGPNGIETEVEGFSLLPSELKLEKEKPEWKSTKDEVKEITLIEG